MLCKMGSIRIKERMYPVLEGGLRGTHGTPSGSATGYMMIVVIIMMNDCDDCDDCDDSSCVQPRACRLD